MLVLPRNCGKALVEKMDVHINEKDDFGRTALLWAVENNHQEVVELLLEIGADGDLQDHSGQTALFRAAWRGWGKVVESLLVKTWSKTSPER